MAQKTEKLIDRLTAKQESTQFVTFKIALFAVAVTSLTKLCNRGITVLIAL